MKLEFDYNPYTDIVIAADYKYSGDVFRTFADEKRLPLNIPFELVKREDGIITIHLLETPRMLSLDVEIKNKLDAELIK